MKSVFDGYLTEGCKTCDCWMDGTNESDWCIGCGTSLPIDWCPYFREMMEKDEKERSKHEQEDDD